MTSRIMLQLGDRTVYWDVADDVAAILAQNLVQSLGPADGDV